MAKKKTMDGNEAAAYASYAFTEVATIYPITPSSPMAEHVDTWAANGMKNIFGQSVRLVEMQSEAGACGAMQGSLECGSLTTSYTASQGLALMIPPLYRIAGQLLPGVLHVAARTLGTGSFSIFGDHQDVMACRQTGVAQLASSSVQECMDMAAVAHLSAIKGRVPFMHFFDGFRTSHEIQKIDVLDYADLAKLVDQDALRAFRKNSLNSERPVMRSTVQNPDTFFQSREAVNPYYDALPGIVEHYMGEMNRLTGRDYRLFNYYGAPDAEHVVIAMGSVCDCLKEVVEYLNARGRKTGLIQVHLYRPFSVKHLLAALPESCRVLTALDRTKEAGANGDPLYEDVAAALVNLEKRPLLLGGRYGLSSKDTTPAMMKAVYDNMAGERRDHFTVGINDDLTHRSLPVGENIVTADERTISCKFWGLGSDGTVGANKNSIKIIGDNTDQYVQAYFEYDTKKSGGVTKSHLRFGHTPILSTYYVTMADFVACHNESYMKKYDIVDEIKEGGTFLLNTVWTDEELERELPNRVKRVLARRHIRFYTIDATDIAGRIGLGNRTNTVLQAAFFKLSGVLPIDDAVKYMKDAITRTYGKKGEKVLSMNYTAVDEGVSAMHEVAVPAAWADLPDEEAAPAAGVPEYVAKVMAAVNGQRGDQLPVSTFKDMADGTVPVGTSKYEKRGFAAHVPEWDAAKCVGCNLCSLYCPHAAIRPFLLDAEEAGRAPEGYATNEARGKGFEGLRYRMQVDVLDCTGCGTCVTACPAKALEMKPIAGQLPQQANWDYSLSLSGKENPMDKFSVKGSQFEQPLLEFSGACAGCGETAYMKLLTQLYGDRMIVANATGCTQAWGFSTPSFPYTTNSRGHGPALSNSLFENNAEYSLGMCLSMQQQRSRLAENARALAAETADGELKLALEAWLEGFDDDKNARELADAVIAAVGNTSESGELVDYIKENEEHLVRKSMWMYGGDGWAYDIGYGGLDHVLASGLNVNVLVFDTEGYSNTGGQASKATPTAATAQFAAAGKAVKKKDLAAIAMSYGYVYVAQVAMGADYEQCMKAFLEAEAYDGPSLIIAYAPCINHGIKAGMSKSMTEMEKAVKAGYWHLFRYDPRRISAPFRLDSKEPNESYRQFVMGEHRYSSLTITFPERAKELLTVAENQAKNRYLALKKRAKDD